MIYDLSKLRLADLRREAEEVRLASAVKKERGARSVVRTLLTLLMPVS